MLKYVMCVAFAVILGIAVMILPLMMFSHHVVLTKTGKLQISEAEKASTASQGERTASSITNVKGYEGLTSIVSSSLLNVIFIVATGLAAATAISLLAKRRLLL